MLKFLTKSRDLIAESEALPGRDRPSAPDRTPSSALPSLPPYPAGIETAYFGMGCFWGAERSSGSCRASARPPSVTWAA